MAVDCTIVAPTHHQVGKKHAFDDIRPASRGKIAFFRLLLPLPSGSQNPGVHQLGFVPRSISVRNYSDQDFYVSTIANNRSEILAIPELIVPARTVYNAPFGIKSYDQEFYWDLPGSSYGNASVIMGWIYEDLVFTGDEVYDLPSNLNVNAVESYEKSATIVSGLTPGGSLAGGATDVYPLHHASADLTVAADGQPMQFESGASSSSTSAPFTLYPGEARSLGARIGYVQVTNLGGAAGGYRILNLYQSQTL